MKRNGRFVERKDNYDNEEMKMIYTYLSAQRRIYNKGLMPEGLIKKLKDLGFELIFVTDDELWSKDMFL